MTEDQLCRIFAETVKDDPEFACWFLLRTKFAAHAGASKLLHEEQATIRPRKHWWRHWWCYVPEVDTQRETDIFMVFEPTGSNDGRFALHIENKTGTSRFRDGQAEAYRPRGRHMQGKPEFLAYTKFSTVLLAPDRFRTKFPDKSDLFDKFISYEEISEFLPEFRQ